jgi:hypothetical protein
VRLTRGMWPISPRFLDKPASGNLNPAGRAAVTQAVHPTLSS